MEVEKNTEIKILQAARQVFVTRGFDGARMQEIAEVAGINKALLHYYFRSKEKLFQAIIVQVFADFMPQVTQFMNTNANTLEKITFFVNTYINVIYNNQHVPQFIVGELNRNPQNIINLLSNYLVNVKKNAFGSFAQTIKTDIEKGLIKPIEPIELIINMLSLCLFPFIARPLLENIMFEANSHQYELFLQNRKQTVVNFIINSIC